MIDWSWLLTIVLTALCGANIITLNYAMALEKRIKQLEEKK